MPERVPAGAHRLRLAAPDGLSPAAPLLIQRYEWRDDGHGNWQSAPFTWAGLVLGGGIRLRPAIGPVRDLMPGDGYVVPAGAEVFMASRPNAIEMRVIADAAHAAACLGRIAAAGGPALGAGVSILALDPGWDRDGWAARARQPVPPWLAEACWWSLAAACARREPAAEPRRKPPVWLAAAVAGCTSGQALRDGGSAFVRQCGRSAAHVNRMVRDCYGCTLTELVNRLRVTEAERILAATGLSTAQVAARVGFANRAHFHRIFAARHGGCGPGAWRRRGV